MMNPINDIKFVLIVCLTLGLAPFVPEPHIWGKLKWITGGGIGMNLMDYFDLFYHGFPWLLLFRIIGMKLFKARNNYSKKT